MTRFQEFSQKPYKERYIRKSGNKRSNASGLDKLDADAVGELAGLEEATNMD